MSAASQLDVVLVNTGVETLTTRVDFSLGVSTNRSSSITIKSLNLTVLPFVVTNKTAVESAAAVRYDFTMLPAASISRAELLITCPAGVTATYGTGVSAVSLCNSPYSFSPALSYMDVVFRNDTDNPLSVDSSVSFSVTAVPGSLYSKSLPAISVNSPNYANSTTFAIAKASVASMEVSLLNYSLTIPQGKERIRFVCPEGVRGFKRNNNYSFVEVCNTDMVVPAGSASANSQDVFFTNAGSVAQTATLSYVTTRSANPDDATWEKAAAAAKKDTISVRPVLVPNKIITESGDPLRLTITKPAYPTAMKVDFLCPQGTSAKYKGVELCVVYPSTGDNRPDLSKSPISTGGQVFNTFSEPLLPAYIDVIVSNSHPFAPAYVNPRFSYTANTAGSPQYSLNSVAVSPSVAVQVSAYFDKTTVASKGSVTLNMTFPPRTKGKIHLECHEAVETSFAGGCNRDFAYTALPTAVSFSLTNYADEQLTTVAKVCAYPSATSTTCSEFFASVEVEASKSIIDMILGAFDFSTWRPLYGDSTDKLIKTAVVKYNGAIQSIVLTPPSATYAIVRAWGGAGGSFGNDNWSPYFALANARINFTPGGYGGFVAGKVPVRQGDYFAVNAGGGGSIGTRKNDNNDRPGTPGDASTVSFNDRQIMVAGGGAQMLHTVAPTLTYIAPTNGVTARIEEWRVRYSSGGSQYAGVTDVPGVTAAKRSEVVNNAKNSHNASGMTRGGGGRINGGWYVWPWFGNSYEAILTGGSSYIDSSVLNPTYYVGNPTKNISDNGSWEKYFPAAWDVALPGHTAGAGAIVIEFWGPANAPETCTNGASNYPDCTIGLPVPALTFNASPVTVVLGQPTTLAWSSGGVTTCSASAPTDAGLWSGSVATSGLQVVTPMATGTKNYQLSCVGSGGDVLRTASVNVTTCTNGATNPPACTDIPVCANGAVDYPVCTVIGVCSNGATNYPVCTTGPEGCLNGATNPPVCDTNSACTNGATNPPLCTSGPTGCLNGATNYPECTTGPGGCLNGATNPPLCNNPVGLSMTASSGALSFKFIGTRSATSDLVTVNVTRNGFSGPVTISVGSISPTIPADVSVGYSLGSEGATSVTIPAGDNSTTLRVRLNKKIPGACEAVSTSGCTSYSVRLNATAVSGAYTAQTSLRLNQNAVNPAFIEQ
jgi:hypothetical protein